MKFNIYRRFLLLQANGARRDESGPRRQRLGRRRTLRGGESCIPPYSSAAPASTTRVSILSLSVLPALLPPPTRFLLPALALSYPPSPSHTVPPPSPAVASPRTLRATPEFLSAARRLPLPRAAPSTNPSSSAHSITPSHRSWAARALASATSHLPPASAAHPPSPVFILSPLDSYLFIAPVCRIFSVMEKQESVKSRGWSCRTPVLETLEGFSAFRAPRYSRSSGMAAGGAAADTPSVEFSSTRGSVRERGGVGGRIWARGNKFLEAKLKRWEVLH